MNRQRLTLMRRWYDDERTIGELFCGSEFVAFTMEPGRLDKEFPRVPTGFYLMERHDHPSYKYRDTWALQGRDVSHAPTPGIDRSAILFHSGNLDEQTKGCILLGNTIGRLNNEPAVLPSRDAMNRLRTFLGNDEAFLVIRG